MKLNAIGRVGIVVLLAASLGCGIYATINAVQRARIVHQLDYEEGNILNAAHRINQGLSPYPDPHGWPSVINPYGPVPYYLTAGVVRVFGTFGTPFAPAREQIIVATLLCAVLIGLLVQHFTRAPLVAVSFAALFVCQWLVQYWMPILRVDFIGLALALIGIYVFLLFPRWWFASVILLSLSIFTKYSLLAAPTSCFVYLLTQKQYQRATRFAIAMLGSLIVLFGSAQILTRGAFAYDVLFSHADPMIWANYARFYKFMWASNPLLMATGVAVIVTAAVRRDLNFPTLYLIFSAIGTASAGKLGSNINHMNELIAALCIADGVLIAWLLQRTRPVVISAATISALLGVWMLLQAQFVPTAESLPDCVPFYRLVNRFPGDRILSEELGALAVNNKTLWVSNPFVYSQLAMAGKDQDTQLVQHLKERWFDLVVLRGDPRQPSERWTPSARQAVIDNYDLAAKTVCLDASFIYVPKKNATSEAAHRD